MRVWVVSREVLVEALAPCRDQPCMLRVPVGGELERAGADPHDEICPLEGPEQRRQLRSLEREVGGEVARADRRPRRESQEEPERGRRELDAGS